MLELCSATQTVQINFNPGTDLIPRLSYKVILQPYPVHLQTIRIMIRVILVVAITVALADLVFNF
ncbi:hypothetical protein [Actibacterium sp. 188UL27-1]|uniref:hypothetical protein n=1 Tax=Actibacterium sp. 188UL27-1 TaxID=2786961 RepID=UPI0019595C54|nr:hypothetical protein [Actibacterium sp. 188UL27-1]MBM7069665.1 hypothetical protein [Actibacterium sp. 188UL27-1]